MSTEFKEVEATKATKSVNIVRLNRNNESHVQLTQQFPDDHVKSTADDFFQSVTLNKQQAMDLIEQLHEAFDLDS